MDILWPGVIRPYSVPGLTTCLEERRLCRDGQPIDLSRLEKDAVALAEWAGQRRRVLVMCPADPMVPLAEIVAAAVHIADMSTQFASTGVARSSRRRVAVATSNVGARTFYRSLGVRYQRSSAVAPLRDAVPAAAFGRDGVIRVLGRDQDRDWSTIFVDSISQLRRVRPFDLAVVDLPMPGAEDIGSLGVPAVLIARDPSDRLLARIGDDALQVGWGAADIAALADGSGLSPRLSMRARGSGCEVIPVTGPGICENAGLFWQDVGALVDVARRSMIASELAREAFALFHDLIGLAMPMALYESLYGPIRARISAIGTAAHLARGDARDLYIPMVEAELRDLAAALGSTPPKHTALIGMLTRAVSDGNEVMLVARTAGLARAYAALFAETTNLRHVRVASISGIAEGRSADVAYLTGMAPTWARWIYRSGIAKTIRILSYATDPAQPSAITDFDESSLVRSTLAVQRARESWLARPASKDRVWSELSGSRRTVPDDNFTLPAWTSTAPTASSEFDQPPEVPPGLWGGEGWLASLEPGAGSEPPSGNPPVAVSAGPRGSVDAVRVIFEDRTWSLLEKDGFVTRFRPGSGTAEPAFPVSRLTIGDQVLFLDGDSRKDLLGKVIEVAEEVPSLALAAGWLSHWRRVLTAGKERFKTYAGLTAALHRRGCSVEPQTVRLWVVGKTIGPDDPEDVRRVAEAVEDGALRYGHSEVCRAMRSLRGAHVRLGNRLSRMAMSVGAAAAAGRVAGDEVVDERTGLTAADFLDSVSLVTVASVQDFGSVPYMVTGRLHPADEEDEL